MPATHRTAEDPALLRRLAELSWTSQFRRSVRYQPSQEQRAGRPDSSVVTWYTRGYSSNRALVCARGSSTGMSSPTNFTARRCIARCASAPAIAVSSATRPRLQRSQYFGQVRRVRGTGQYGAPLPLELGGFLRDERCPYLGRRCVRERPRTSTPRGSGVAAAVTVRPQLCIEHLATPQRPRQRPSQLFRQCLCVVAQKFSCGLTDSCADWFVDVLGCRHVIRCCGGRSGLILLFWCDRRLRR